MADIGQEQLTAFWKQPTDQYGSYDINSQQGLYKEQWKGSMTNILRLYNTIQSWKPKTPTDVYTYADFRADAVVIAPLSSYYDTPTPPQSAEWTLADAEVQELQAGDNAMLNLTWGITTTTISPGGEGEYLLDWHDSWSLSWQSQTYSLFAYCGYDGEGHIDSVNDMNMLGKIASRSAIESWMNQPQEYQNLKAVGEFNDGSVVAKKLNAAELNIKSKIDVGKTNPIFHYPILTKTSSAEYQLNQTSQAMSALKFRMEQPDVITVPLQPFDVPTYPGVQSWKWLCQGSNVSTVEDPRTKKVTVTVSTSYWGAAEWDENFYGVKNRWQFGMA